MKLRELFDHLAFSELSQLVGIDSNTGLIAESAYDKVLSSVSLGLTALHSRFFIKEGQLTIGLEPGRYSYLLKSDYTVSKGGPIDYILDSVDQPFRDDLLKIEAVHSLDKKEFPLNDRSNKYSIHTPTLHTLVVPKEVVDGDKSLPGPYVADTLVVTYRANHKILPLGFNGYDADLVEIDLPYNFVEPLLYFVGSRLHNPMGLVNDFNAGNNYAAKYERACAEIERSNVRVDQDSQNSRFEKNGWV